MDASAPQQSHGTPGQDDRKLEAFRPIRSRKVADEVAAVLADAIRGGLYEPGDKLPRERDLAAQLAVSRAAVREAVGILARADIVSVRRGNAGGVVVITRVIPPLIADAESQTNLRSVLEVRRFLEPAAMLGAAERMSEDDLEELRRLVEVLEDLKQQPDEFLGADTQFHLKVGQLAGNPLIARLMDEMYSTFMASRAHYPVGRIDLSRACENQRDTLTALESRDPRLILAALDVHLGSSEEHFLGERLPFPAHLARVG